MKKIYYATSDDSMLEGDHVDEVGEVEGFLDESGNVLHYWSLNDGDWRGEYFDPLLKSLGIKVVYEKNSKSNAQLVEAVAKDYGLL